MNCDIFKEVDDFCNKKCLCEKNKEENINKMSDNDINYYPNCDPTIWMRSCNDEVIEPMTGRIQGVIPGWLCGTLLRNGPGSLKVGDYQFDHLFDSSALLHRYVGERIYHL